MQDRSQYSAAASLLVYVYLCRLALLESLKRLKSDPAIAVAIETLDDVVFEAEDSEPKVIQTCFQTPLMAKQAGSPSWLTLSPTAPIAHRGRSHPSLRRFGQDGARAQGMRRRIHTARASSRRAMPPTWTGERAPSHSLLRDRPSRSQHPIPRAGRAGSRIRTPGAIPPPCATAPDKPGPSESGIQSGGSTGRRRPPHPLRNGRSRRR